MSDEINIDNILGQEFDAEVGRQMCIDLRRRVAAGEAVPPEELAKGLALLRKMYGYEAQLAAKSKEPAKKKAAPKKKKVDADELLGNLLGGL